MDPRPSRRADVALLDALPRDTTSQWILGRVVALTHGLLGLEGGTGRLNGSSAESSR